MGRVSYNFKNQSYSTILIDDNNEKYTYLAYYNNIISDNKEREILSAKLNKLIHNLLEEMNFEFDNLTCSPYVCINANQKFDSMEKLDRYDEVYINISDKDEISKEVFAEMVINIIPEIKSNMYYKEKSKIGISYQFVKEDKWHYIKFSVNEPDIKLTKEHIVEFTTIVTWD